MTTRGRMLVAALCALVFGPAVSAVHAETYRTRNFVVEAGSAQAAQAFGEAAERYRKQKALEWLGREMPPWPRPCPLRIMNHR